MRSFHIILYSLIRMNYHFCVIMLTVIIFHTVNKAIFSRSVCEWKHVQDYLEWLAPVCSCSRLIITASMSNYIFTSSYACKYSDTSYRTVCTHATANTFLNTQRDLKEHQSFDQASLHQPHFSSSCLKSQCLLINF